MANDASDNYTPKSSKPNFVPIPDYHPDSNRSSSALFMDEVGPDTLRWVLQVKGLGVMVFRTCRSTVGVELAIFSKSDIGPCPNL